VTAGAAIVVAGKDADPKEGASLSRIEDAAGTADDVRGRGEGKPWTA
jgi:hypothetical protein